MLTITLNRMEGASVIGCQGPIVQDEEAPLLCILVGLYGHDIVLDLSQTTTIDRSGIRALLALQAAGIFLTLRNPSRHVLRILELNHVESLFKICQAARTPVAKALLQQR